MNARTQSNLKGEILDLKVALQEWTTGKRATKAKNKKGGGYDVYFYV